AKSRTISASLHEARSFPRTPTHQWCGVDVGILSRRRPVPKEAKVAKGKPGADSSVLVTSQIGGKSHGRRRFARSDGADNEDAGVQTAFGNGEPRGLCGARRRRALMLLAQDQEEILAAVRRGVQREHRRRGRSGPTADEDVDTRRNDAGQEERRRKP